MDHTVKRASTVQMFDFRKCITSFVKFWTGVMHLLVQSSPATLKCCRCGKIQVIKYTLAIKLELGLSSESWTFMAATKGYSAFTQSGDVMSINNILHYLTVDIDISVFVLGNWLNSTLHTACGLCLTIEYNYCGHKFVFFRIKHLFVIKYY